MEDEENEQSNSEKNEEMTNGIENEDKGDKKSRLGILQKLKQNSDISDDTVSPSKKAKEKESIMQKLLEAKRKKEKLQQEFGKKMNNDTKEEDDNKVKNERERLRTRREENDEERHKSKSIAKANPNLQNKLRQLFQNRIVQVETRPEEKEEDDEADKDLDPELRREKKEKNQIKQQLLKIAMEKKKKQEKEERRLRKLQREQEEQENDDDNNNIEESKTNTEDNNEYKEEKKDKGGFRSIIEQIKQKKSQKEALQRSFEQPAMNSTEESKKDNEEETEEERKERERILEMVRKQEEKFKREEEARLAEEKRKEEIKRQEEEKRKEEVRKLKEEIKRKEELQRQEEERIRLEKKKAEEEEKKRLIEMQKEEERKLREKLEEERIQREKEKKEEEERIRKEEERKRQIELEREEEERKQKEEEERLREKFKREEMERIERLKREAEEKEKQEKLRKEQEERERLEKIKKEEEERLKEELRKKEEEERLLQEQLKKQEEEEERIRQETLKKQEEECKRKEEEEKRRKEEEERKRRAILEEQERKKKELEDLKRQAEEERIAQLKKEEEARKLKEKLVDDPPLSKDADYLQQRYQQSEDYKRTKFSHQQPLSYNKFHFNPPKLQPEQSFEQYQTNTTTYQKPYQKKQNIIYNPKKPSIRGRSVEKVQNANLNNTQMYSSPKNYSEYPNNNNLYDISSIKTNEPYTKSPSRYTKNTQFFGPNMPSLSSRQVNPFHYNDYYFDQNQHMTPPVTQYNNTSNESLSINLEDLMILEEKLNDIISNFITNKIMTNECFEWWNYYFNCSLFNKIEKAFKDESSREVVQTSINYELLSIIIAYDVSFDKSLLDQIYIMLKPVLYSNHHNLIIICEYILSKVSSESLNNLWVLKLRNLVNSVKNSKNSDLNPNGQFGLVDMSLTDIDKIRYNTNSISSSIRIILKNYPHSTKTNGLINLYKNITKHTYEEINDFFQSNIMRVENPNASVLASVVLRENGSFSTVDPPYLKTKNLKKYTLVLDLDETILHFKINPETENEGVLKVRPGIHEFLETLGKMYEIVVFTAATKEYADILIDEVEENRIYFDFRLYRQHTVIINNDFVKDLTRLGRPLDKVIIVDNMPQNFRLQKENGINIRAFWGEDRNDTALIELMPILMKIAMEGGDVRKGLAKYKDEIVKKVTMNVSKYN